MHASCTSPLVGKHGAAQSHGRNEGQPFCVDSYRLQARMARSVALPEKPPRGCTCTCRADADDSMPGNVKVGHLPYAFATATASDCAGATKTAKHDAIHTLGMKPKHVKCRCSDD